MIKKIAIVVFFLLSPLLGKSQILNIERYKIEKDTTKHFMFKTTFGLNVYNRSAAEDSPVNLFGYNLDLNAMYYPKKHAYTLVSRFDYLRINDNNFLNFGFVHARLNFLRENKLNYDVFTQYSYDNFRGLDPRIIVGGSLRYNLIKNENLSLVLGVGGFFESERWFNPITEETVELNLIKNSNYLSFRYSINEILDLNTMNYYQVGYDDTINGFRNRISSITTLNTKISSWFSLTNSLEINYEDRPVVPITPLIFAFRTGISVDF